MASGPPLVGLDVGDQRHLLVDGGDGAAEVFERRCDVDDPLALPLEGLAPKQAQLGVQHHHVEALGVLVFGIELVGQLGHPVTERR